MTRAEFDNLKVGDLCMTKSGDDKGRIVTVRHIEDGLVVIKAVDGGRIMGSLGTRSRYVKMVAWYTLDVVPTQIKSGGA